MIPPVVSRSTNSNAERRLFRLLQSVEMPGSVAYHSLQLSRHDYKRAGEIDFLISAPEGLLVVEVKGGRVACADGIWTYTDRYDVDHHSGEGPFRQASSAMFALEARLRAAVGSDLGAVLFGYAVATPDTRLDVDSIEWEAADSWDVRDLGDVIPLARAVRRSLDSWASRSPGRTLRIDAERQAAIGRVLRPDFDRVPSLRVRTDHIDESMEILTEEQYASLDLIEQSERILYRGGAGTGKTFLAVETARREGARGRTLLVCAGDGFARFLRSRIVDSPVEVRSISELRSRTDRFDVMVVDEAQDVMNIEDLDVLDRSLVGGLAQGRWRMFVDHNRQHGLVGRFEREALDLVESLGPVPAKLTRNCRNTTPIVTQTRLYTAADVGLPRSGEGPSVEFVPFAGAEQQVAALDSTLRELGEQDVAGGKVTVLSPRSFGDSVASRSREARKGRLRPLANSDLERWPVGHSTFATVADFKGMENTAVVIVDLDQVDLENEDGVNLLYVAMTRARAKLVVLVDEDTGRQLARIAEHNLANVKGLLDVGR